MEEATEKQKNFMKSLGLEVPEGITKHEARLAIDGKVNGGKPVPVEQSPMRSRTVKWEGDSDKDRQRLIVRQSCLKAAIEFLAPVQTVNHKDPFYDERKSPEDVTLMAEKFEAWVFR